MDGTTPTPSIPPTPPHGAPSQPAYVYYPMPNPRRPGILASIGRFLSGLFIVIVIFMIGFYCAMAATAMGPTLIPTTYRQGPGLEKIAIVPIEGVIGDDTVAYAHAVVESILADKHIKAVILRVQSPGGGASASDQILHELQRLKKDRNLPVIASYGYAAASGGYYVSCHADKIFAEPTCITGSIGVIAQVPTLQGLLENKLGVKYETITADGAPKKEVANNIYRDWTEADRAETKKMVNSMHARFTQVVQEGRAKVLTKEKVVELAVGLAYTADEAKASGLIDEIGYLDAAIAEAEKVGGFKSSSPTIIQYQQPSSFMDMLGIRGPGAGAVPLEKLLDGRRARQWVNEFSMPQILMQAHL